jgi:hypothetical protein
MTTVGQAFLFVLFVGNVVCLAFAAIALFYFADRLRSDFLLRKRKRASHRRVPG